MDASGLIQSLKNNPIALAISIALHIVFFVMLAINLSNSEVPQQKSSKRETVKAFVVDAAIVDQEIKKLKQSEINKKQKIKNETDRLKQQLKKEKNRLAKIKKEKKDLERKAVEKKKSDKKKEITRKKTAADKKKEVTRKKLEAEKKAEKKAEVDRLAEIKRQQDEVVAQKRRKEEEAELKHRMEEEERRLAKHNDMLASLRSQYVRLIEQKVERNWLRPATVSSDFKCEVFVTQSVLGDVINVRLGVCASDIVFRNSIERAVRKSSPLPPPPNPEVFDREIRFVFRPSN